MVAPLRRLTNNQVRKMDRYVQLDDKYEAKICKFQGNLNNYFNSWAMRVTTALRNEALVTALTTENVYIRIGDRATASIVAILG